MASVRARTPRAQPPTSTERGPAARARPWWLVLLACCRGVWAAGGASQLDPALAIQCREPVIAGGEEGKALIVSAQRPSSWQHRPGWTTWSERGVIKRCDGSDDLRLWYSVVSSEAKPEEDPAVSLVGGRPSRSRKSSELFPVGARYQDQHQKRCLRVTLHHAIPFDHRLETYHEDGIFHAICRPVGGGALSGWPSPKGKYKDKWARESRARMLTCFYSAEALHAIMLGVPQLFQVAVRRTLSLAVRCFLFVSLITYRRVDGCCPRPSPRAAPRRPPPPNPPPSGWRRSPPNPSRTPRVPWQENVGTTATKSLMGRCVAEVNYPDVIGARCPLAEESAIRAARILFKRATPLSAVHVDWTLGPCTSRYPVRDDASVTVHEAAYSAFTSYWGVAPQQKGGALRRGWPRLRAAVRHPAALLRARAPAVRPRRPRRPAHGPPRAPRPPPPPAGPPSHHSRRAVAGGTTR